MSATRSWFNFKNKIKHNITHLFEKDVNKNQAIIKSCSLDELYQNHQTLVIFVAAVTVISIIIVPLMFFGITQGNMNDPVCWFITFALMVGLAKLEYMLIVELVATNRTIKITEKYSATKRRHNIAN